jgi:fatty acid desaturase
VDEHPPDPLGSIEAASTRKEKGMAARDRRFGGISLGGILVIVGIVVMIIWSFWLGLIIALIGLVAFGGFVRGRWY